MKIIVLTSDISFIYGLFNDGVGNLDFISLNGMVSSE
jgi:hypothetical protein